MNKSEEELVLKLVLGDATLIRLKKAIGYRIQREPKVSPFDSWDAVYQGVCEYIKFINELYGTDF